MTKSRASGIEGLIKRLNQEVPGQIAGKKALLARLSPYAEFYKRGYGRAESGSYSENVLVLGPQGCGKATLIYAAADLLQIPVSSISIGKLLSEGRNALFSAIATLASHKYSHSADEAAGILVVERIDQFPQDLQEFLITSMSGTRRSQIVANRYVAIDTNRVLFIGTCENQPTTTRRTGFRESSVESQEFSLIPALASHFGSRVQLIQYSSHELEQILMNPAMLNRAVRPANMGDIVVSFELARTVASAALKRFPKLQGLAQVRAAYDLLVREAAAANLISNEPSHTLVVKQSSGKFVFTNTKASPGSKSKTAKSEFVHDKSLPTTDTKIVFYRSGRPPTASDSIQKLITDKEIDRLKVPIDRSQSPTVFKQARVLREVSKDGAVLEATEPIDLYFGSEVRRRHILAVGKTGSGKTQQFIIPMLANDLQNPNQTVVVIDAQIDLVHRAFILNQQFRGKDAPFYYVNFKDEDHAYGWNPLKGCEDYNNALDVAASIAQTTEVKNATDGGKFFNLQAKQIIAAIIHALVKLHPNASLVDVRRILEDRPTQGQGGRVEPFGMVNLAHASGSQRLIAIAKDMLQGAGNAQTVLMEADNMLQVFDDQTVARMISCNEFDFKVMEQTPCCIVLGVPEHEAHKLRPLTNIFVQRLFNFVIESATNRPDMRMQYPVSIIADEFGSAVGKLQDLDIRINTLRKRGLSLTAAVQTLDQIRFEYGPASSNVLAAFSSMVMLPPVDFEDAGFASRRTGETYALAPSADPEAPTGERKIVNQPLLTAIDIAAPPHHEQFGGRITGLFADLPPMQMYLPSAFKMPELQNAASWDAKAKAKIPKRKEKRKAPTPYWKIYNASTAHTEEARQILRQADNERNSAALANLSEVALFFEIDDIPGYDAAPVPAKRWWRNVCQGPKWDELERASLYADMLRLNFDLARLYKLIVTVPNLKLPSAYPVSASDLYIIMVGDQVEEEGD